MFVETQQNEYIVRYRLYELKNYWKRKTFRISNSEIVNTNQILNIDLSIVGRICIRFPEIFKPMYQEGMYLKLKNH